MKNFTTFDSQLMEFFKERGIFYTNSFQGKNEMGYDYGYIENLKGLLAEYNSLSKEDKPVNKNDFEKMMQKFLKDSDIKLKSNIKEHTKNDTKRKKADNANRRKIALKKRGMQ